MRRLTRRYSDTATFLRDLRLPLNRRSGDFQLSFLGDLSFRVGEVLRLAILIDDLKEHQELHLRITGRSPEVQSGEDIAVPWRYEAVPTLEDRVWMEMLFAKCNAHQRFSSAFGR